MKSANHNIQKVFLEMNTRTSEKAYSLKDSIDDFLKEHLFPFIENYFNSLSLDPSLNYQIEDLQLSLNVNEKLSIEEMIPHVKKQLDRVFLSEENNIVQIDSSNPVQKLSSFENKENTLLYFLEHGKFPWWIENTKDENFSVEALLYDCIDSEIFIKKFKLKTNEPEFRKRSILQISNVFLSLIVLKITNASKIKNLSFIKSKSFYANLKQVDETVKLTIWNVLIDYSQNRFIDENTFETFIYKQVKSSSLEKPITQDTFIQIVEALHKNKIIQNISIDEIKKSFKQIDKNSSQPNTSSEVTSEENNTIDIKKDETFLSNQENNNSIHQTKKDNSDQENKRDLNHSEKENIKLNKQKQNLEEPILKKDKDLSTQKEKLLEVTPLNTTIEGTSQINSSSESHKKENVKQEGIYYVENAGLILLHPFLKSFFVKCNLLEEDNNINDSTLAVHLLHYLATGKEQQFEHLQLMEKFLCHVPLQQPIHRSIHLSDELKENAQELLEAVLSHLPQLKSTSVSLFQHEFLQRPGKLIFEKNTTRLIIEQKTQDLLLKNIPWNISVIKLPWLKNIFFVDW